MAQNGMPSYLFHVPTDTIDVAGNGRELIGEVPEPATLVLMGTAGLVLAGVRRRRGFAG